MLLNNKVKKNIVLLNPKEKSLRIILLNIISKDNINFRKFEIKKGLCDTLEKFYLIKIEIYIITIITIFYLYKEFFILETFINLLNEFLLRKNCSSAFKNVKQYKIL